MKKVVMNRSLLVESLVLALLVTLGAGVRIVLGPELPNFAPIAAISLFAGYFFHRWWVAALAPWLSMTIADAFLGGYEWQMMVIVYAMIMLPMVWSGWLRKWVRLERSSGLAGIVGSVLALVGCSLVSSVLFFLATNFAWLPWSTMYSHDLEGLMHCYQQGLPFFRNTLLGDLFFAFALFGSYAFAVSAGWVRGELPQTELARV
ncbi:DUF6580 family putative transport protein [Anatilimnocola sp. NA78]|uniref:DUF6580 family putative transport protein n=1 Tax=Anatilimnocola sp. NA78 TaxID=3415683 RepID=UPI003CE4C159